jgi:hypothetical protein
VTLSLIYFDDDAVKRGLLPSPLQFHDLPSEAHAGRARGDAPDATAASISLPVTRADGFPPMGNQAAHPTTPGAACFASSATLPTLISRGVTHGR